MDTLTIETLITEGKDILDGIKYVPSRPNAIRMFSVYQLADEAVYERWKNIVIRFLSTNYSNDISVSDFRTAMEEFEKKHHSPSSMRKMLGILEAYQVIPVSITTKKELADNTSIVINNNNHQTQNQVQNFDVFIKSIEDSFTISQLTELREIVNSENGDMEKAKPKLIDKLKSFGTNLAPSIVANIMTNPSVWTSVFGI